MRSNVALSLIGTREMARSGAAPVANVSESVSRSISLSALDKRSKLVSSRDLVELSGVFFFLPESINMLNMPFLSYLSHRTITVRLQKGLTDRTVCQSSFLAHERCRQM